ncbi:MAG: hypothetical protein ACR5K7_00150 [Symbiopectobacterium sp.]
MAFCDSSAGYCFAIVLLVIGLLLLVYGSADRWFMALPFLPVCGEVGRRVSFDYQRDVDYQRDDRWHRHFTARVVGINDSRGLNQKMNMAVGNVFGLNIPNIMLILGNATMILDP